MNGLTSLAFPGTRTLAAWWKQLAGFRPQGLWVAHLAFHRLEALVRIEQPHRPDPLALYLLHALQLEASAKAAAAVEGGASVAALDARLHLGNPLIHRLLAGLAGEGLAHRNGHGGWLPTPQGQAALSGGSYARHHLERRTFYFREFRAFDGAALPPHFLPFQGAAALPMPGGESWDFPVEQLHACVAQSTDWKRRFGFPGDVAAVLTAAPEAPDNWRRVVVDRSERLLCAVIRVAEPSPRLIGFAARQEGWLLQPQSPAFVIEEEAAGLFPEMAQEPAQADLEQALRAWGQQRGLPAEEFDGCSVELAGTALRVHTSPALMERLRASCADTLKGDVWLFVDEGAICRAAVLEFAG